MEPLDSAQIFNRESQSVGSKSDMGFEEIPMNSSTGSFSSEAPWENSIPKLLENTMKNLMVADGDPSLKEQLIKIANYKLKNLNPLFYDAFRLHFDWNLETQQFKAFSNFSQLDTNDFIKLLFLVKPNLSLEFQYESHLSTLKTRVAKHLGIDIETDLSIEINDTDTCPLWGCVDTLESFESNYQRVIKPARSRILRKLETGANLMQDKIYQDQVFELVFNYYIILNDCGDFFTKIGPDALKDPTPKMAQGIFDSAPDWRSKRFLHKVCSQIFRKLYCKVNPHFEQTMISL